MVSMTAARDVLCAALQPVRHVGCTRWDVSLPTSRQPTCKSTNNVTPPRLQLQHSGRCRCDVWPVSLLPPLKCCQPRDDGPASDRLHCDVAFWSLGSSVSCTSRCRKPCALLCS